MSSYQKKPLFTQEQKDRMPLRLLGLGLLGGLLALLAVAALIVPYLFGMVAAIAVSLPLALTKL